MSPALFNLFVNDVILKLKSSGIGCRVNGCYVGVIMYADDIFLLCPTLTGLQNMLNICGQFFNKKLLEFNVSKSACFVIGKAAKYSLQPMTLQNEQLAWKSTFTYLGVCFVAGKSLSVDINPCIRKFYAACNGILGRCRSVDELTKLSLIHSSCLPLLAYAIAAVSISNTQLKALNTAWNNVYRAIFNFGRWESVKLFIAGLGFTVLKHTLLKLKLCFIKSNMNATSNVTKLFTLRFIASEFHELCLKYALNLNFDMLSNISHKRLNDLVKKSYFHAAGLSEVS